MPYRHDRPTIPTKTVPLTEMTDRELEIAAHRARIRRDTALNASNATAQSIGAASALCAEIGRELLRRERTVDPTFVERPDFDDQGNPIPVEHDEQIAEAA